MSDTSSRPYEVERDRFGVYYSGPLEVGECIEVVSVHKLLSEEAMEAATRAAIPALMSVFGCDDATAWNTLYGHVAIEPAIRAAIAVATSRTQHGTED